MRLVEVLVASTVLAVASTGSLQMAATSSTIQQGTLRRERQWAEVDRDRLRLQAIWRQARLQDSGCLAMTTELLRLGAALPPSPQLERKLRASTDGTEVLVDWSVSGESGLLRQRRFSPAALGLCPLEAQAGPAGDESQHGELLPSPGTNQTVAATGAAVQP